MIDFQVLFSFNVELLGDSWKQNSGGDSSSQNHLHAFCTSTLDSSTFNYYLWILGNVQNIFISFFVTEILWYMMLSLLQEIYFKPDVTAELWKSYVQDNKFAFTIVLTYILQYDNQCKSILV